MPARPVMGYIVTKNRIAIKMDHRKIVLSPLGNASRSLNCEIYSRVILTRYFARFRGNDNVSRGLIIGMGNGRIMESWIYKYSDNRELSSLKIWTFENLYIGGLARFLLRVSPMVLYPSVEG